MLLTVKYMLEGHGPINGTLKLCCDSKLALSWAASIYPISITEPHANILSAIVNMRKQIMCSITFQHVYGHQDTGYATVLGRDATLNVEMDLLAKAKIEEEAEPRNFWIPFEGWTCYIGNRKIIKQVQPRLHEHINGAPLGKHWTRTRWLGQGMIQQVDWESVRQAMSEVGWKRRKWVTKFVTGEFEYGENMQRWWFQMVSQCLRCSQDRKTSYILSSVQHPQQELVGK